MTDSEIKAAVRERDGQRCTVCGMTADEHRERYGTTLHVHRIEPGSLYSLEGCVTLCNACHALAPKRAKGTPDLTGESIQVRLDSELLERIQTAACSMQISVAGYVRMVVIQRLNEDGY